VENSSLCYALLMRYEIGCWHRLESLDGDLP